MPSFSLNWEEELQTKTSSYAVKEKKTTTTTSTGPQVSHFHSVDSHCRLFCKCMFTVSIDGCFMGPTDIFPQLEIKWTAEWPVSLCTNTKRLYCTVPLYWVVSKCVTLKKTSKETNSVASVRQRTIPSDVRLSAKLVPTLADIYSATCSAWRIPTAVFSDF
jgi:hypothetical protein